MTDVNKTYLEMLDDHARLRPTQPIFWIPQNVEAEKPVSEWKPLTYGEFHANVSAAKHFYDLQRINLNIPKGSVIGLWLSGHQYTDPIQTLGISAAGFIPQLFSLYYSHSPVVFELLLNSGARALVVDSRLPGMPDLSACPVKVVDLAAEIFEITSNSWEPRPYFEVKDDIAYILHSSGSTARIPKIIPRSHRLVTAWSKMYPYNEVAVKMGNFNHGSTMSQLSGTVFNGTSMIIPSSMSFSPDELRNMIRSCGLKNLTRLTPLLVSLLETARGDPTLLSALKSLSSIACAGVEFPTDLAAWCRSVGLTVINIYASTECGGLMRSSPFGSPSLLKPLPAITHKFLPYEGQALELVIPPDSIALPHPSLLAADGQFYTGDLFEPTDEGYYIYKGRKNDWVKTGVGAVCDLKSIEDAVNQLCKDMVFDCVAVGAGRRCPALLVELVEDGEEQSSIPQTIIERLAAFNESRFPHERLDDPRLILIVDRGVLPRTAAKGNIRRQGSEELFLKELNEMYTATASSKPQLY